MRLVLKITVCLALWFCFACEQEQNMPIEGDFSIAMVDDNYNAPAQVRIINKITGADAFQWEFPNGSYTSSNAFYPEDIRYIEAGTYMVIAALASEKYLDIKNARIEDLYTFIEKLKES